MEKTLITHASDERAKFLGYEIKVIREGNLLAEDGRRAANGAIALLMPRKVVSKYLKLFSKKGRITHRAELLPETDYTIIQRYQSVLRGLYNFYCMAYNVSKRMRYIDNILRTSLLRTLASKLQCSVNRVVKKYRVVTPLGRMFRVIISRPEKEPLIATYGGIPFKRMPQGQGRTDYPVNQLWYKPVSNRSELVQRLLAEKCELCGKEGPLEAHHIRKIADIDRPGRRPTENWQKIMAARKRKSLVVCAECHDEIHAGRYDGPPL
ncbi:MAG TPA: group II intron reverse transcriptase/maturase [Gemmataceae bacterium]|nr:group II intron reverse transcriptase/maturase [Gemmataceae bacterium]